MERKGSEERTGGEEHVEREKRKNCRLKGGILRRGKKEKKEEVLSAILCS